MFELIAGAFLETFRYPELPHGIMLDYPVTRIICHEPKVYVNSTMDTLLLCRKLPREDRIDGFFFKYNLKVVYGSLISVAISFGAFGDEASL